MLSWIRDTFSRRPAPVNTDATAASTAPSPSPAEPWRHQALQAIAAGDLAEAARCYGQAIEAAPKDATLRLGLGSVLLEQGQHGPAAVALQQALALRRPEDGLQVHGAQFLLGRAHVALGELRLAASQFEAAVRTQPDFPEALEEGARTLFHLQRHAEAADWAERLVGLQPGNANGWLLRHLALVRLDRQPEALDAIERALAITGPHPTLLVNRSVPLERMGRTQEALDAIDQALALDPGHREARGNRVPILVALSRVKEAIAEGEKVLRDHPEDAKVHAAVGHALLLQGDLQRGWREYEWRLRTEPSDAQKRLGPGHVRWQGESLAGRTIFLHAEQGFGDNLLFLRFVPEVARQAKTVLLLVTEGLEPLVAGSLPANCRLLPQHSVLPPIDFHCPLMSVPMVLGTTLDTIPSQVPYLRSRPETRAAWEARLGPKRGLRVGVVWSGNPKFPGDGKRSMALERFRAIDTPGVQFVCLQKVLRPADRDALAAWPALSFHGDEIRDFGDTAALADLMDLVVSTDTSVVHLCGALARPMWVLLGEPPDWRWLLGREDSPWYPTARLFRQPASGDWDTVLRRVRGELEKLAATAPA